jgi:hypothetical protein
MRGCRGIHEAETIDVDQDGVPDAYKTTQVPRSRRRKTNGRADGG